MPVYECNKDCHGINSAGQPQLFVRGQMYELTPEHPCARHFKLSKAERKVALEADRKRREEAKANQERRALAKAKGVDVEDLEES